MKGLLFSVIISALPVSLVAHAEQPAAQRGETFVQTHCAGCHATGATGDSPLANAPPFRTLHHRYPVESLEEALGEGIRTGHRTMPEFVLGQEQIRDLIAYLRSLEH